MVMWPLPTVTRLPLPSMESWGVSVFTGWHRHHQPMGMTLNEKFSNVLLVPTLDVATHICARVVRAHMLHLKARKLAFSTRLRTEMSFCSCPPKKLTSISILATLRWSMEAALTVKPLWFCFTDWTLPVTVFQPCGVIIVTIINDELM